MRVLVFRMAAAAPQKTAPAAPTFYKDVLPVLQDHCQSCHRPGEVAPMPLVTYEQTRPWAGSMAHAVEMKMMPPWFADPRYGHFANDVSLTEQQIATIVGVGGSGSARRRSRTMRPRREDGPRDGIFLSPISS